MKSDLKIAVDKKRASLKRCDTALSPRVEWRENWATNFRVKKEKGKAAKISKTYNSRYSLVVTHPTTNLPI
jgi:hypothetical protein